MKIEIEHVCRNIYSYGGTEVWAWLRKLVLVYETDTGERIRLRGRKFSYEGENSVTREKIQFGEKKNSVKREKIR